MLPAHIANEGSLARVNPRVARKTALLHERLAAHITVEGRRGDAIPRGRTSRDSSEHAGFVANSGMNGVVSGSADPGRCTNELFEFEFDKFRFALATKTPWLMSMNTLPLSIQIN